MFKLTGMELGGSNPAGNATISEGLSEPMPYRQVQGLGVLLQDAPNVCQHRRGKGNESKHPF